MIPSPVTLGFFLLSLLASAWFSAVEISLISANRFRLLQDAKEGKISSRLALTLLEDKERVLTSTLVGINLFNLTAAATATAMLQGLLSYGWAPWQVSLLTTGGVTLIILIGAEIVPKIYSKERADRFLAGTARPILATEQLLLPVTAILRAYVGLILRILRRSPGKPMVTREELKLLVHDVKSETGAGRKEKKMLRSILDFGETVAREVMLPMTEAVSVERGASVEMVRAMVKRHGFTRLPVYEKRVDKVVGLVNVYDILFDAEDADSLDPYIRTAKLVPETKRIDRLLTELQRERQTMAVVVSEFGSCTGIVTVEDIVEEIVGELAEEHEVGVRKIREMAPRTYLVDALTDVDDVNEELALRLPKDRFETMAGLVLKRFGRIPSEGEWFEIEGVRIEVVDTHSHGIRTVKLVLPERRTEEMKP